MNNIQRSVPVQESPPQNIIEKFEEVIKAPEIIENIKSKEIVKSKYDLTSIKGFTEKKKKMKILKMKEHVMEELKSSIDIFDINELKLNHSLVLFVAQIVEDFFNKPLQGEMKREVVIDICKPFFNDDQALVEMVLELVFDKVIKTTFLRRNKQRIKNIAAFFLELFSPLIQSNLPSKLKL
jgi:hypothetical protein